MVSITGFFPAYPYEPSVGTAFEQMTQRLAGSEVKQTVETSDWHNKPFTGGGYPFPAPGEVTTWGPIFTQPLGRLYFAGDCTNYAHVGYMEGALRSGETAATRVQEHFA